MNCPHCNGRNFAWARRCEHCGHAFDPDAASGPVQPALPDLTLAIPEPPELTARRARQEAIRVALAKRGTRVVVTPALAAINVALFLLISYHDPFILSFDPDLLLRWGANYGPDVTGGAWWRLVTAMFLHGGLVHLVSNMFVLLIIGPVTERLFGSVAFAVVYTLAGLGGAIASLWWHPVTIGIGASGAIFGLYGSLLAFLFRRHATLPREVVVSLRNGAIVMVVSNIVMGVMQAQVDNSAHIGGLLTGFAAGLALTGTADDSSLIAPFRRSIAVACIGGVLTAAAISTVPRYDDLRRTLVRFVALDDQALATTRQSLDRLVTGRMNEDDCVAAIEGMLPSWRALRSTLASMHVPDDVRTVTRQLVRYMNTRDQAWTMTAEALRKQDVELFRAARTLHNAVFTMKPVVIAGRRRSPRPPEPATTAITLGSPALNQQIRNTEKLDETSTRLYNESMAKVRNGRMSLFEMAGVIERQIIAPWSTQYDRLMALSLYGPPAWTRKPVAEFMRRRLDAWRLTVRAVRERNPLLIKQAMAAQASAGESLRR